MSHKLFIYGESGHGKTSSLRNLDPTTTAIINGDKKSLPLQGWRKSYVTVKNDAGVDWSKTNYVQPTLPTHALVAMKEWEKREDIKTIVIDTLTHLMTADYMKNTLGKDFKAYQKMGGNVFDILDHVRNSDKNYVVIAHSDTEYTSEGQKVVKMKSQGRMVDAMVPPSFFTTVLVPVVERGEEGVKYLFRTQSDGADSAKSPCMFKKDGSVQPALDIHIPNDVKYVFDKLDEFENVQ